MTVSLASVGYKSSAAHNISGLGSTSLPQLNLTQIAADNFNRANGTLAGSNNWLATADGSMSISSNELVGGAGVAEGNYRSDSFNSNHYSQFTIGSVAIPVGAYVGLSVRNTDNNDRYMALYFQATASAWEIDLYKHIAGVDTKLGSWGLAGVQAQGTTFTFVAEGTQLTLLINGVAFASAIDATIPNGGTPGIVSFGTGTVDNWQGGNAQTGPVGAARATDNFNRANGGVSSGQANWQVMTYSPAVGATVDATIVTNQVNYTTLTVHGGDTRTDSFASDQWGAIQMGTVACTASGFIMATARCQSGGQSAYIGGLFNNGAYNIYRLDANGGAAGAGTSALLGSVFTPGNDPAGTEYRLVAKGSRISLRVNGAEVLAVTDATYTGGAPGLMFFNTASGDNWSGGNV